MGSNSKILEVPELILENMTFAPWWTLTSKFPNFPPRPVPIWSPVSEKVHHVRVGPLEHGAHGGHVKNQQA